MVDKNRILINYYREGESKKSIAERLNISRKTVRKYILEHEALFGKENAKESINKGVSSKPTYKSKARTKRKLTKEIAEEINKCLSENKKKRNNGFHKQQMKKIDIFEYLLEKQYKIGYTSVCNYVRHAENTGKESFIKQKYSPGLMSG